MNNIFHKLQQTNIKVEEGEETRRNKTGWNSLFVMLRLSSPIELGAGRIDQCIYYY